MREIPLRLKHLGDTSKGHSFRDTLMLCGERSFPQKLAITSITHTLGNPLVNKLMWHFSNADMEYCGAGMEQVVLKDERGVFKIVMRSGNFSGLGSKVEEAVSALDDINSQCVDTAPAVWTPSDFSVVETTGIGKRTHVGVRQPFINPVIKGSFSPFELLRHPAIEPHARRRFARGVLKIVEKVGVMPDLGGRNNVMYGVPDTPHSKEPCALYLVDTIPIEGSPDSIRRAKVPGESESFYDRISRVAEAA